MRTSGPSRLCPLFLMVCCLCTAATAEIIQLQNGVEGYEGARDNTIYEESGILSNGSGDHVFAGNNAGGFARRALIAFDLSGVPPGSIILDVSLTLTVSRTATAAPSPQVLHRLTAAWGEGDEDAIAEEGGGTRGQAGTATWTQNHLDASGWQMPGGDFIAEPSAEATVNRVRSRATWISPGMVADVQAWVDDPDTNFGWILIGDESAGRTAKRYVSSDHDAAEPISSRPLLVVEYEPPSHLPFDTDGDDDVDLSDFLMVVSCFSGPEVPFPPGCEAADGDRDGDVDLSDIVAFQVGFTGSR